MECTTYCSASCNFCPRVDMNRPLGEMSDKLFHKIIKDGKAIRVKRYSPFLMGDPFVFPRIWEWLDYMKKEDVIASLYTNGSHLDVDRIIKYNNIDYLDISLNAAIAETHSKIMHIAGDRFNEIVDKINFLFKHAPFSVRVSFIITSENFHEMKQFKEMFPRVKFCGMVNWKGARHDPMERVGKKRPCLIPFIQMFVLYDGTVVPCCMDFDGKHVLGDANKQTLGEIWNTTQKRFEDMHRRGEWDKIPICKNCNYNVESKYYEGSYSPLLDHKSGS